MGCGWLRAVVLAVCGVGAPVTAQTGTDRAVLEAVNQVRRHPREAAEALRAYRTTFRGRIAYPHGSGVGWVTSEGAAAVDEAIKFLERQAPLPALQPATALARAAESFAAEQGMTGAVGHRSRDGDTLADRLLGEGDHVGETIAYAPGGAEDMVRLLVVDDGERDRGHRALIFSRAFRFAGVGCAPHPRYGAVCVVDYSDGGDPAPPAEIAAADASRLIARADSIARPR